MSYRDYTTFDFEGARLWMLAGANGAGKSTVFDALRWALFGVHRAGKQKPEQLIHHEAAKLLVEVEMRLGEEVYKLKRTLGREGARPTWDVARRVGSAWESVAGTSMANEYHRWVESHIGLTDEAFCASVYLSQGRADAILNADAEARYELLSQLVDLEAYECWHERAEARRGEARAQMTEARRRWELAPSPAPEQIVGLRERERELGSELAEVEGRVRELDGARAEATRWEEWSEKLVVLASQGSELRAVLGDAEAIERDFARLGYLTRHWGVVEGLWQSLSRRDELEGQMALLRPQLEDAQKMLDTAQERNERAQDDANGAQRALNEANATWSARVNEVAALAPQRAALERRAQLLEQQAKQQQLHGAFESDLDEILERAESEREQAQKLARDLPLWRRFAAARRAFAEAQEGHDEWVARQEGALERQNGCAAEVVNVRDELEKATLELGIAREEFAKVEERRRALKVRRADFARVEGEARCHFCGQELSEQHRAAEVERLEEESQIIEREKAGAGLRLRESQKGFDGARMAERNAGEALEKVSAEVMTAAREVRQQSDDAIREYAAAREAWRELGVDEQTEWEKGDSFQFALRDLARARPYSDDFERMENAAKSIKKLEAEALRWQKRARERDVVATELRRIGEELKPLLEEWNDSQVKAWQGQAKTIEKEREDAQRRRDESQNALEGEQKEAGEAARGEREAHARVDDLRRQIGPVEGQLLAATFVLETAQMAFDGALERQDAKTLSAEDVRALRDEWEREIRALESADVAARAAALVEARGKLVGVERDEAFYGQQIESLSELARRPRAQVEAEWEEAKDRQRQIASEREVVGDTLRRLEREEREKRTLGQQSQEKTLEYERWEELARLLGPHQLQRHLLREAEGAIVREANGILEAISGGTLRLELVPDSDEGSGNRRPKVLDVVCFPLNGSEEPQAILPAFLSGSQRFRVAVALALGIGRTAARGSGNGRAARVETILIDEGFGALDKTGRDEMKDELRELGRELGRVILVSHQEDFASAFPNRFNIALENGVSRVQKVVE